jgi:hypothetical protein
LGDVRVSGAAHDHPKNFNKIPKKLLTSFMDRSIIISENPLFSIHQGKCEEVTGYGQS